MSVVFWLRPKLIRAVGMTWTVPQEAQGTVPKGAYLSLLQKRMSGLCLVHSFTFCLFLPPSFLRTLIPYLVYSIVPLSFILMGSM